MPSKSAIHHETPVLVVGGGPVGLILSLQLARFGINCMLAERNLETTKWPKMDCTNVRSMELFKRLGIAEGFREIAVPPQYSFDVIYTTGLSDDGEEVARWNLDSVDTWRQRISEQNDGSMPREPYQRCSQAVLEAWLKPRIQDEKFIDGHFGLKFESFTETDDGVDSVLTDVTTGDQHIVHSKYLVGCDGAGSRVRRSVGIDLIGGPVPSAMMLIHFKSRDLTKLHKLGQFWHIAFSNGSMLIAQDEVDTWTLHVPVAIGADWEKIDPVEAIYKGLGTPSTPYPITVDKILVRSAWRPNICVAEKYASPSRRIFLAGDSAHQNIPTGGYGMNTGIGDAFDLGWKLAATLKGYGGKGLLESYELERLPVATKNIDQSGAFWEVWRQVWDWSAEAGAEVLLSQGEEGRALRAKMANWVSTNSSENRAHGIELGYRYNASPIVVPDTEVAEPRWDLDHYIPSTWPGARPPHVFLSDGTTSIFDLFGQGYTIVDFTKEGKWADAFADAALQLKVPLQKVHLPQEKHVQEIWERTAVLVRPDDHVAWRAPLSDKTAVAEAIEILKIAVGQTPNTEIGAGIEHKNKVLDDVHKKGFSGTIGNIDQDEVAMKAAFQK